MRTGERGFTLIELMVTMAVSLIGVAGLLQLHRTMSKGNQMNARQLEATNFAEAALEAVRGKSSAELTSIYGDFPIDAALAPRLGRNDLEFSGRLKVELVGEPPMELIRLRTEIRWTDPGAVPGSGGGVYDHIVNLELLRTQDEAQ
jgi:prepilin-type N-terminal cleavage/methylation domain-containing protein